MPGRKSFVAAGSAIVFGSFVLILLQITTLTREPKDSYDDVTQLVNEVQDLRQRVEFLQTSLIRAQSRTEELSCGLQKIGSRGGFCLTDKSIDVGGNWVWDLPFTLSVENLFENQTVGDFGAGLGWYGRYFLRIKDRLLGTVGNKTENDNFFSNEAVMSALEKPQRIRGWKGYDGAVFVNQMTSGLVEFLDLSDPVWLMKKFDWVLSLEVGEHIPAQYQDIFIDNLVRHACKGVVLSWAIPGQGGHHHVNERDNQYVKRLFEVRGFHSDDNWEKKLRGDASFAWFKNTVMVFRRTNEITSDPECSASEYEMPKLSS